jgi:hypothetical protein
MNIEEKIMTLNHDGKKGVNISKDKYETMKQAIISIITKQKQVSLSELGLLVDKELAGSFDGKIGWYLMAVKLDLEVRGVITKVPGVSPRTLALK